MPAPLHSLHRLLCRACWQRLAPSQSAHRCLSRLSWQMPAPWHSLHRLLCRRCSHVPGPVGLTAQPSVSVQPVETVSTGHSPPPLQDAARSSPTPAQPSQLHHRSVHCSSREFRVHAPLCAAPDPSATNHRDARVACPEAGCRSVWRKLRADETASLCVTDSSATAAGNSRAVKETDSPALR